MKEQRRETKEKEESLSASEDEKLDFISRVPDSILSYILSFLQTREAVCTSILSSRWRTVWTLVPTLDLDQEKLSKISVDQSSCTTLGDILSNLWMLRSTVPNSTPIQKLRIHWFTPCFPLHAHTWIRANILHGLQDLDLSISTPLELPRCLFFCTTLVLLKLKGQFLLNPVPSASTLPSLKTLLLQRVHYANPNSLSTLLAACPVLQDLTLTVFGSDLEYLDNDAAAAEFNIIVLVPTLETFLLRLQNLWYSHKIQINTPALKSFQFLGWLGEDVVLENLPNLVKLFLHPEKHIFTSYKEYSNRVLDFMRPLYNVKSMEFHIKAAQFLNHASKIDDVPMFHNLSSLKFYGGVWCKSYVWNAVRPFLCRAPKLQTLAFELTNWLGYDCYAPVDCLEEPLDVPECLSSHLTTCYHKGLSGNDIEMQLVRQILKAARVLKTMNITVGSDLDSKAKLHIHEELVTFPRSSQTCQIVFD
ncbi:hypothetical protein RGQ29_012610 [Quercus rubra]|uniref:FBD domain-containing protein n=1 Tax=Quercus rubra TaxID=3512 RepID=A0AAN7G7J2_QUERU|nr:hypothetical protein RGQ29_012610 [Quercus rubra]